MTGTMNWSDFTVRAKWAAGALGKAAMGELGIAGMVCLAGGAPFLGLWFAVAGLMTFQLAGVFSWSGKYVERSREKTLRFKTTKAPAQRLSLCVRVCNRVRAYRRASRASVTHSSDGGSGDSSEESDSGDPPGPSHHAPLRLSQTFYRKLNSFSIRPRLFSRRPGCWCMSRCKCAVRGRTV
jgi:hypothetical protein